MKKKLRSLEGKKFYLFKFNGLNVVYWNAEPKKLAIGSVRLRQPTEKQKQYWFESMEQVGAGSEFSAVSLCDYEIWEKEKGFT